MEHTNRMKVNIGPVPNWRFYHNWFYDWFGYTPKQKTSVKIHNYDTWSMDHTLAPIILPMLVQLKETKHGSPFVDNADVPKELRLTKKQEKRYLEEADTDPKHFERWDWILDEMIWAFEQKCRDDWMEDYDYNKWDSEGAKAHQERMSNGFRLFGTYYENLWD